MPAASARRWGWSRERDSSNQGAQSPIRPVRRRRLSGLQGEPGKEGHARGHVLRAGADVPQSQSSKLP